jgi:hypothetical protein
VHTIIEEESGKRGIESKDEMKREIGSKITG